ncbi:MAG: hypothetical protein PUE56_04375 [Clostridium sp.]|nr:hypothetical protein [Clostridium sp.]
MSATVVEDVKIVFSADTKDATKNINSLNTTLDRVKNIANSATKSTTGVKSRLTSIYSTLNKVSAVTKIITDKCAEWFKASNDYVEALNLFEVSMGNNTKTASEFAKELQNIMGIDIQEWINYQGGFNQMLLGFGLGDNTSAQMSQQLTQIAYDLSSLWNVDVETAFQKLQSGMSGQIKGLKVWGINLSVAQLKETALAHGIELSTSKMTESQKAVLRYITIMDRTKNVQGDLARTIITPANAMRILSAQTTQAKRSLGNIVSVLVIDFIPVLQVVVRYIDLVAKKIATLMGYELPQIDYSGISDTSFAFDSLDDSMKDALETSKKLKKSLMGFDELNVLQAPTSSNSSVLGGGLPSDLGLDLDKYSYDFTKGLQGFDTDELEQTLAKITAIVSGALLAVGAILLFSGANIPLGLGLMAVGAIGLAAIIAPNWETMSNSLRNTLATITGIVAGFTLALGAVLTFTGHPIIGLGLLAVGAVSLATSIALDKNSVQDTVSTVLSTISGIVSGALLAVGAILAISGVNVPLGIALIAAGAVTLVTTLVLNWETVSDNIKGVLATITLAVSLSALAVGAILAFTNANLGLGIALMALGAASMTSSVILGWDKIPTKTKKIISTITTIVGGALLALGAILTFCCSFSTPLGIALMVAGAASLATSIALNWNSTKDKVVGIIQTITTIVGGALLVLGALLVFTYVNVPLGIALLVAGALSLVASIAINWNGTKEKIKTVLSTILSIVSGAAIALGILLCLSGGGIGLGIALIRAGLSGVKKADEVSSNPVTKWIKSICNGAIDLVEKAVNKCIKLINKFGFSWDVPDWLQSVVGFSRLEVGANLSEVSIPRLAKGGMDIPNGQIFQARESGPELVGTIGNKSAVVNNDQIVESVEGGVFRGVMAALQNSHNGNGNGRTVIEAHFYLDGQEITDNVIEHHNDYVKANGSSPLLIGG